MTTDIIETDKARIIQEMADATPQDIDPRCGGYPFEEFTKGQLVAIARYLHAKAQKRLIEKMAKEFKP